MSLDASRWAWQQMIKPASVKLVLLSLADRASPDSGYECYPSCETLCSDTGLDRKTVLECMKRLVDVGLIADTNKRKGSTGQVKVYKLVGVVGRDDEILHFIYKTTDIETNEFYIGLHTAANENDNYKGSGKWVVVHKDKTKLKREILSKHASRKEAEIAEALAINLEQSNPFCRNRTTESHRLNSTENGTVPKTEQYRKRIETVPFSDLNSTENGMGNSTENGTQNLPIQPTNNLSIESTNRKNPKKPQFFVGVKQQIIDDYLAVRKAKKAPPISQTVFDGLVREANKAGFTLEQALITCCERNWVGFNATWVNQQNSNRTNSTSIAEQNKLSTELARQKLFGNQNIEKDITHEAAGL